MRDIDKALSDILAIKAQLAAGTAFRGYGPGAVAATGLLALAVAGLQHMLADGPESAEKFLAIWVGTAILSVGIIGAEMIARSRRHHLGLSDAMIHQAIELFVPAGMAGFLLLVTLLWFAPDTLWMLPGLWQILVGLGVFASLRLLPRPLAIGGAFYVSAGIVTLALTAETRALSPWAMGLPFAAGQLLMGLLLRISSEGGRDV